MHILLFEHKKTFARAHYKGIVCVMPKFIVNISLIFTQHTIQDRFVMARDHGFVGVEILTPYALNTSVLAAAAGNVPVHLINAPFGPEWGRGGDPDNRATFMDDIHLAVRYASALNARHIHVMAGAHGDLQTLTENLSWAVKTYPEQSFLIEPINILDIPGYVLHDFADAVEILEYINAPNLGLQFDTYHASRVLNSGDIYPIFETCLPWIKHIQVSGNPNRTEPDQGIVDHAAFFAAVDEADYDGLIGAEYRPDTGDFDWMKLVR
jgi:hydroxypyruvate isomerase